MPLLINPRDHDLFAPQIHQNVPGRGSVDINEEEADMFEGNSVFRVHRPVAEPVAELAEEARVEPDDSADAAAPTRRQVTRGGQRAEVDGAPPMETR